MLTTRSPMDLYLKHDGATFDIPDGAIFQGTIRRNCAYLSYDGATSPGGTANMEYSIVMYGTY